MAFFGILQGLFTEKNDKDLCVLCVFCWCSFGVKKNLTAKNAEIRKVSQRRVRDES
jgi:hypothetical protein